MKNRTEPNAISALRPNAIFNWSQDVGIWLWESDFLQPTQEEIDAKIAELEAAEPLRLLRIERNRLLQETDWRFRSDLTPSQAWIEYCQDLRDLPETQTPELDENGNLINVNWPTPPTE